MLNRNKELLATVARTLGGEVRLEPRLRRVPFNDGAAVSVVMGDPPRMVLPALVEALGMANAPQYIEQTLVPFSGRVECERRGRPVTYRTVCD